MTDANRPDEHQDEDAAADGGPEAAAPGADGPEPAVDAALARLTAAWPTPEMTEEQRRVYRDVLADVDPEALERAVESLLRDGREERPPPGLVRERATGDASKGIMRWLPAAVLAVAVAAAVVSIMLVLRGGDERSETLPSAEELQEQVASSYGEGALEAQNVLCTRHTDDWATCEVLFVSGGSDRVAVVTGDEPGEFIIDRPATLPAKAALEQRLVERVWDDGATATEATCRRASGQRATCTVAFQGGTTRDVVVTPGPPRGDVVVTARQAGGQGGAGTTTAPEGATP